jgi:type IV pilus assembly protein PilQ
MSKYHHYIISLGLGLVFSFLLFTLFSGCADQKQIKRSQKDAFFDKWKVRAEASQGYSPAPKKRVVDLQAQQIAATGQETAAVFEKALPTQEISMTMHNVNVSVLLRTLARAADINIMINQSVKGKADVNINKAPWDQVFRGVLSTHGLTYAWVGKIIRIMTIEDREQDLKRESQKKEFRLAEPLMTRIVPVDYADAQDLKANLDKFLTRDKDDKPIGSVMVDEHTKSLIIQAVADDFEKMIALIKELDRPTPQVLIEVNIVEATRSTARDLGVQWGGLYKQAGGVNHYITPGARSTGITAQTLSDATGAAQAINPTSGMAANFPADNVTAAGSGLMLGYVYENIGKTLLTAQLSALQTEGKLNILSSPSITTVDNMTAIIESGKKVPYQSVDSNGNVSIEYKDALLRLEVRPHVIDGEILKMEIKTTKDELDFANAVGGQPAINTKKAETTVILRNGETTVIGGLNKEKVDDSVSGAPWLKDIPVLGWLFKTESKDKEMDDLLIFITPYILKKHVAAETQKLPGENMVPPDRLSEPAPAPE